MILELYIKVVFLKVRAATPLVVGKKHLLFKKKINYNRKYWCLT